jgi:agmatinase
MPRNPERPRINRPFVGIPSFLRSRICNDIDEFDGAISVLDVPFDEGSPFLAGSRFGSCSIREHSLRFVFGDGGFYNSCPNKHFFSLTPCQPNG